MELKERISEQANNCVQCGFCLPHCPTYAVTNNEAESPRGRISLMLAIAEGELEPTAALTAHLDTCLSCRACEAACPSKVEYGELLDNTRQLLAQKTPAKMPWWLSLVFETFPKRWLGYCSSTKKPVYRN